MINIRINIFKRGQKMDNVEQFIDQLIDEKDLNLEDDVRQELKVDMINRLLDQIDAASINALPEDKAIELADKLDDPDFSDDDLTEFMRNSGVDLESARIFHGQLEIVRSLHGMQAVDPCMDLDAVFASGGDALFESRLERLPWKEVRGEIGRIWRGREREDGSDVVLL